MIALRKLDGLWHMVAGRDWSQVFSLAAIAASKPLPAAGFISRGSKESRSWQ
jgi:hypothetical protein